MGQCRMDPTILSTFIPESNLNSLTQPNTSGPRTWLGLANVIDIMNINTVSKHTPAPQLCNVFTEAMMQECTCSGVTNLVGHWSAPLQITTTPFRRYRLDSSRYHPSVGLQCSASMLSPRMYANVFYLFFIFHLITNLHCTFRTRVRINPFITVFHSCLHRIVAVISLAIWQAVGQSACSSNWKLVDEEEVAISIVPKFELTVSNLVWKTTKIKWLSSDISEFSLSGVSALVLRRLIHKCKSHSPY